MTLDEKRRQYAQAIAAAANLQTAGLADAFAAVPRETFLPPGPWTVVGEREAPRQTPGADPQFVYENVSVAIDLERQLFNGARRAAGTHLHGGEGRQPFEDCQARIRQRERVAADLRCQPGPDQRSRPHPPGAGAPDSTGVIP